MPSASQFSTPVVTGNQACETRTSIGEECCTFPCQKFAPLVSLFLNGAEFALSVAKNVALFETVCSLRFASVKWRDRESKPGTNDRISGCTVLILIGKMNQIIKYYWKQKKRLCVRLRSGDKHHLRKSADRKAQIRKAFFPFTGLICASRSADLLRWYLSPERNLTHNLFFYFQ